MKFRNTFYELTTKFKATIREIHFHLSNIKRKTFQREICFYHVKVKMKATFRVIYYTNIHIFMNMLNDFMTALNHDNIIFLKTIFCQKTPTPVCFSG